MSLEAWIDANMESDDSSPDLASLETALASYEEDQQFAGLFAQPADNSFIKLVQRPKRHMTPSILSLYLRVRPRGLDSQFTHPIRTLLGDHLRRGLDHKQGTTRVSEDELAELLALLFAAPGLATWKGNQPNDGDDAGSNEEDEQCPASPADVVRQTIGEHIEQYEVDDDGLADRILAKIQCINPEAYLRCTQAVAPLSNEAWLSHALESHTAPASGLFSLKTKLDSLDAAALARVLTVANTQHLFEWIDRDTVNGERGALCLYARLHDLPTDVLLAHSAIIFRCADEVLDGGDWYYQHENYYEFWEGFCASLARTALPTALVQAYAQEMVLPRLGIDDACLAACNACMLADLCAARPEWVTPLATQILETVAARDGGWEGLNKEAYWGPGKITQLRATLEADEATERPAKVAKINHSS